VLKKSTNIGPTLPPNVGPHPARVFLSLIKG
jgi:hypothetical protein